MGRVREARLDPPGVARSAEGRRGHRVPGPALHGAGPRCAALAVVARAMPRRGGGGTRRRSGSGREEGRLQFCCALTGRNMHEDLGPFGMIQVW